MLRMEIALFLVLAFVACIYFSAGKRDTLLHRTFTYLLITVLVHLIFDSVTVYTVNMLDTVPRLLNDTLHRLFVGTMVLVLYLFYQYIAILVEEETEKSRHLDMAFVIVSGYDDFSYCQEALRLQITDYILKPVDYEEFGTCIDNLKIAMFRYEFSKDMGGQEEFHLSAQYISQLFKTEIGVNFLAYLTNIRMEKAKKLLLSSSLSVAEISEQSGYSDYRVFTKVFKKSEGITPSQYRKDFLEG